jgi:curved DNA-binding protein CbpA
MSFPNYYEFLQISPNAEPETIHRVYRFLAMRFHPDNPETGDPEKFQELKQAYEVLSDGMRRAEYDAARDMQGDQGTPISASVDFMDQASGELNRRLAVLALLYIRRRNTPDSPAVSLFEIEERMGFPREYLEFTLWYLQRKGYISRADNAEYALLADGVDFVETQRQGFPVLNRLLTDGSYVMNYGARPAANGDGMYGQAMNGSADGPSMHGPAYSTAPFVAGFDRRRHGDRRKHAR